MPKYKLLEPNHYLSTQARLVREWRAQDVVTFSQLVDFTAVETERARRKAEQRIKPSYTAFVIDSIARALRDHPKLNRMIYFGLAGYRWAQFEQVDIAVAVEVVQDDLDIAYASLIRNADQIGLEGISDALLHLAAAPADDRQLKRLSCLPAALTAVLARATGLHPHLWVRFRGGSCCVTSPAKYGVESVTVKSCWPMQFAFGKVKEQPMVVDGRCVPRAAATVSMSWHRELTTGAVAARFFDQIVRQLQQRPN
jgi:pyruvate/2-oxoglutarate dehydrogenase complex dihydrolipoamide acyltransferase (E2) component